MSIGRLRLVDFYFEFDSMNEVIGRVDCMICSSSGLTGDAAVCLEERAMGIVQSIVTTDVCNLEGI